MITFEELEAEVRRLADADPEHVYVLGEGVVGCKYRPDEAGSEACIFGQALDNLGVGELIREGVSIVTLMAEAGIVTSRTERRALWADIVQSRQDGGVPWAKAVQSADDMWPLHKTEAAPAESDAEAAA